jgi:leucyl-tRNA synthetase
MFVMFAAPPEQSLEWSDSGVEGAYRFLKRLWRQVFLHVEHTQSIPDLDKASLTEPQKAMRRQLHLALKKASDDYGRRYTFNTVIAINMELVNALAKYEDESSNGMAVKQEVLETILLMLSPITPHVCEQLWQNLGHESAMVTETWPEVDESALEQDSIKMMLQVNGKLRGDMVVPASMSKEDIEKLALVDENVQRFIDGKSVKKVIVVPKRLINIVV